MNRRRFLGACLKMAGAMCLAPLFPTSKALRGACFGECPDSLWYKEVRPPVFEVTNLPLPIVASDFVFSMRRLANIRSDTQIKFPTAAFVVPSGVYEEE